MHGKVMSCTEEI